MYAPAPAAAHSFPPQLQLSSFSNHQSTAAATLEQVASLAPSQMLPSAEELEAFAHAYGSFAY